MPRPRSPHVADVKARLIARLRTNYHRPGDRFLSARAVAEKFAVSYQTAHRLLAELHDEGLLLRKSASGTFLPGGAPAPTRVALCFHPAQPPRVLGHRLANDLATLLARENLPFSLTYSDRPTKTPKNAFPVLWEVPAAVEALAAQQHFALLLNDRPPPGLHSLHIDSVSTDDYSGGAVAAQLIQTRLTNSQLPTSTLQLPSPSPSQLPTRNSPLITILSGPPTDPRSNQRLAGFQSLLPATVIPCPTWFVEDALKLAPALLARKPAAIFCCNDRLAQAVIEYARHVDLPLPPIVGFDDAPVAERLNLTTLAIPWPQLLTAATALIKRRLTGDRSDPVHQIIPPRPIIRTL